MQRWSTIAGVVVMCLLLAGAVYLFMDTPQSNRTERVVVGTAETAAQAPAAAQQNQGQTPGGRRRDDGGRGDQRRQFGPGGRDFRGGDGQQRMGPPFERRSSMTETMNMLGEANLRPDFDLTKEQKEKILAIRDGLRAAREKWQTENAAALRKIEEEMRAARDGGADRFDALRQKRDELMAGMPNSEDAIARIKALLTPEQLKIFETMIEERRRMEEEMRQRFGGPGGGPPFGGRGRDGGGPGFGPGAPGGPPGGREPGRNPDGPPGGANPPAEQAPAQQREI